MLKCVPCRLSRRGGSYSFARELKSNCASQVSSRLHNRLDMHARMTSYSRRLSAMTVGMKKWDHPPCTGTAQCVDPFIAVGFLRQTASTIHSHIHGLSSTQTSGPTILPREKPGTSSIHYRCGSSKILNPQLSKYDPSISRKTFEVFVLQSAQQ